MPLQSVHRLELHHHFCGDCQNGAVARVAPAPGLAAVQLERTEPGDFDEPHDIFIGGSQGRMYIADRRNNRIQVFDQDGNVIAAWKQFGQPSSVFVGKDDSIYVGASFRDPAAKKGELRGIMVGNAKDGSLKAFIPDPADPDKLDVGTTASGIAADDAGSIYAADVAAHNLRKYVKVQ